MPSLSNTLFDQAFNDLSRLQTRLPEEAVAALAREVITRLAKTEQASKQDSESVDAMSNALIGPDPKAAPRLIEQHLQRGAQIEELYLDLLGPAARKLGEMWESDEIHFTTVTIGTGRIYAIMRTLASKQKPAFLPEQKSAVFAALPGEDHTLGVRMAADLARKAGWQVQVELNQDHDTLIESIQKSGHLLIGLSCGGLHTVPQLARLVLALRISVPNARILVSGNPAAIQTEDIKLMHVDAAVSDFDEAMEALDAMWDTLLPSEK
ncbi:Coenzyme B12-binding [Sulfitobacter noctilucicola]|uniref:Methanogenic corrinoid protein MtbC1 n=1 Tax=Sulfitobacter noctilucicola TaxID=1342301 RepID=A0A7W6MC30_9RHOB|nr:cobalamin-dependent protein [Sulfitobacter noctilucicola]KIN70024.1 Coenzyme B12-binding [Sulfitobacter noctilucicola]MBB4176037.1 methanogenic corrinoid protein MtbC1 [Sulfitobacter noctilucicola]